MDSITQAALGGLCGELTLRKQLGWKGMAWGLFFGTLPDLDILAFPFIEPIERLSWHRGLSHSILCMLVATLFFGWLLSKIHKKRGVSFKQAAFFVLITWGSHVAIDCFTTYGTQIFEPFSSYRFAWDNMSIIDLSFTVPMLLALLVVLFFNKESHVRSWLGRCALAWLCMYTLASFTIKSKVDDYFQTQLSEQGITPSRMMTSPTISNIFLWRMVAEADGQYHVAYWSFFDDPARSLRIDSMPKGHEKLESYEKYPETAKLKWFAKDWHMVVDNPGDESGLLFIDMRFTEMCLPKSKGPVFVWKLQESDGELDFDQVSFRKKVEMKAALSYLWERINGGASDWMEAPWPWEKK